MSEEIREKREKRRYAADGGMIGKHIKETLPDHRSGSVSLSKNYANTPASAIIEETGVFTWKVGEKMHGGSQSS